MMTEQEKPDAEAPETAAEPANEPANEPGAEPAAEATAAPPADDTPPVDVADLQAQIEALRDKALRAMAETENLRRRAQKEREDATRYAIANFARDMVTIADNLRRALDSVPEELRTGDEAVARLVDGVALTERQLEAALERHGVTRIDAEGERFNHEFHEAMLEVPTDAAPPGTVVQLLETGYMIHDRLLRPARVGVAKALSQPDDDKPDRVDTTV